MRIVFSVPTFRPNVGFSDNIVLVFPPSSHSTFSSSSSLHRFLWAFKLLCHMRVWGILGFITRKKVSAMHVFREIIWLWKNLAIWLKIYQQQSWCISGVGTMVPVWHTWHSIYSRLSVWSVWSSGSILFCTSTSVNDFRLICGGMSSFCTCFFFKMAAGCWGLKNMTKKKVLSMRTSIWGRFTKTLTTFYIRSSNNLGTKLISK